MGFYAFSPSSVIPAVFSKIQREEALGVVVLPDWPAQGWYPKVLKMLKQEPIYLIKQEGTYSSYQVIQRKYTQFGTN